MHSREEEDGEPRAPTRVENLHWWKKVQRTLRGPRPLWAAGSFCGSKGDSKRKACDMESISLRSLILLQWHKKLIYYHWRLPSSPQRTMKILSWNCCGFENPRTMKVLQNLLCTKGLSLSLDFLMETRKKAYGMQHLHYASGLVNIFVVNLWVKGGKYLGAY